MSIEYKINEKTFSTKESNDDIIITNTVNGSHHKITVKALKDLTLLDSTIDGKIKFSREDTLFFNGYQSWTDSHEKSYISHENNVYAFKHLIVKKYALDKYGDASFYHYNNFMLHGYDLFYSKGEHESFIYNLNYKNAYLICEYSRLNKKLSLMSAAYNKTLKAGEEFTLFEFKKFKNYEEGLTSFKKDFSIENHKKIFGYTSWYNYYQNINEEIILRDLDALDSRFNLFQIDDGYETKVGDWTSIDSKKFPNGLNSIVEKIHSKGLKAGIWLAPFVAEEESELFKNHKELFKKDSKGKFIKCGSNWSGFYALDLENKKAIDHIKESLQYYVDMGFDFFKLDFLYAAGLPIYQDMTRAQMMEKAYTLLKEILKDKLILGCGATLFNSYKKFDYLRVGPDVSLEFNDVIYMRMMHRERNSTKVTIKNTIFRSIVNNSLFNNDPDVFLLRDDNIKLNNSQKESLIIINALFGNVLMTSDNIATYDEKKKELLAKALDIFINATNQKFVKKGDKIDITYMLHEKEYEVTYDAQKGVLLWK